MPQVQFRSHVRRAGPTASAMARRDHWSWSQNDTYERGVLRAARQRRRAATRGAPTLPPVARGGSGRAPGAPRLVMRQARPVRQVRKARQVRQAREARHSPSAPSAPGAPSARNAPVAPTATEMPGVLRGTPSAPRAPNATGPPRRRGRARCARCVMVRQVHHVSWVRLSIGSRVEAIAGPLPPGAPRGRRTGMRAHKTKFRSEFWTSLRET